MIKSIKKYQFLFTELVKRDFKKKYKRTVLGMGWSLLSPLLVLAVMAFVFTNFFGRETPHYIIYLFSGNLVYSYFNDSSTQGMRSLMENAHIFTKVTVPKYLFIVSKNVQTTINFALSLCIYFLFCLLDHITFTWKFVLLLYPIIMQMIFNIGIGMILSALFMFFKDIQYLWTIALRLILYLSAIFYRVDKYPESMQIVFYFNPVYVFITYYRKIVLYSTVPSLKYHLLVAFYAFASLAIGILIYKKNNTKFLFYV